jgi:hypothetical protein
MSNPIIVYGASGYTGKLICWHLAELHLPFIAAGRDKARLEAELSQVPELVGADYEVVEVEHQVKALTELFARGSIVYNVVGPFMQLGEPVVAAALAAGCHYFDTTGETDWMQFVRDKFGNDFAAKGLLLVPACSYMWAAGNVAAEIALEATGIDTLDLLYIADSATSVASTKSFLRMCTSPQHYLEHNQLATWPFATSYDVRSPDQHRTYKALPWSGGGEAIWYMNDERVTNCSTLVGFRDERMFTAVFNTLLHFEENYRHHSVEEREALTNKIGGELTQEEPNREDPNRNRSVVSCLGRGNTTGVSVVLRGNSPYLQTAAIAADICYWTLTGKTSSSGFKSPAVAFGARRILSALADRGYLSWEVAHV